MSFDPQGLDWAKVGGLIPAIVHDAATGQVLMLAYMNREALERTLETGEVTFYSRTRQCLWTKGEISGNVLNLVSIRPDCDRDTLLVAATPVGPTCHLGTTSCFGEETGFRLGFLTELQRMIEARRGADPEQSYTARLLGGDPRRAAQKVGEEGLETALAAVAGNEAELLAESADLVYHLLVLLASRGIDLARVADTLAARHRGD